MLKVKLNMNTKSGNTNYLACNCGWVLEMISIPKYCPNCSAKLWVIE